MLDLRFCVCGYNGTKTEETLTDPIKAALITGCFQLIMASATLIAALLAIGAWRRQALGTRQVGLAEECVQAVWALDERIRVARRILPPESLSSLSDVSASSRYKEVHGRAMNAMRECLIASQKLEQLCRLSEVYLGDFPLTSFAGTTRLFPRSLYKPQAEYVEIVTLLLMDLDRVSPNRLEESRATPKGQDAFEKSSHMFSGFMYEYEKDEYSARLELAKRTFERHIKDILRRRGMVERVVSRFYMWIGDRFDRKFKPVTLNKFRNWRAVRNEPEATKPVAFVAEPVKKVGHE